MLEVKNLSVEYNGKKVLNDVSFRTAPGEWVMLAGPNGAGKSTIANAVTGGAPYQGTITYGGKNIKGFKPAELARRIGMLAQNHATSYAYTVEEVVSLGCYARSHGFLAGHNAADAEKIEDALIKTGLTDLRQRSILTLSGGELQRVFLAQVFAQDPELLILDEPANHLDLQFISQVFNLIDEWLKEKGRAVLCVVHDLSLARAYGSRVILLNNGKIAGDGPADTILTPENLSSVYNMDVYAWMRRLLGQWV